MLNRHTEQRSFRPLRPRSHNPGFRGSRTGSETRGESTTPTGPRSSNRGNMPFGPPHLHPVRAYPSRSLPAPGGLAAFGHHYPGYCPGISAERILHAVRVPQEHRIHVFRNSSPRRTHAGFTLRRTSLLQSKRPRSTVRRYDKRPHTSTLDG